MQDIAKAKRNVSKMVSQNAPEADIDSYISSEGLTLDQIRNFKQPTQAQPEATPYADMIVNQPQQKLQQAIGQFRTGNPNAGIMGLANTGFAQIGGFFGAADKGLRDVASSPFVTAAAPMAAPVINAGLDLAGLVPRIMGAAGEISTKAGLGFLGAVMGHNLGTTPEKANQIRSQAVELGGNLGAWGGSAVLPKVAGEIAKPIRSMQDAAHQTAFAQNFLKANPARVKELNVEQNIAGASGLLADEIRSNPISKDEGAHRGTVSRIDEAQQKVYDQYAAPAQQYAPMGVTLKIAQIKGQLLSVLDRPREIANPEGVAKMRKYINNLPDEIPIDEGQKWVQTLNSETAPYRNATGPEKAIMYNTRPELATQVDLTDAVRGAVLDKLEELGHTDIAAARKAYGDLAQTKKMIVRNIVPAERQTTSYFGGKSPASTAMMVGGEMLLATHAPVAAVGGLVGAIARKASLEYATKDATMRRAMNSLAKTSLTSNLPDARAVSPERAFMYQTKRLPESQYGAPNTAGEPSGSFHRPVESVNTPTEFPHQTYPRYETPGSSISPVFDPKSGKTIYVGTQPPNVRIEQFPGRSYTNNPFENPPKIPAGRGHVRTNAGEPINPGQLPSQVPDEISMDMMIQKNPEILNNPEVVQALLWAFPNLVKKYSAQMGQFKLPL